MSTRALIAECTDAGITLSAKGETLSVVPASRVTDELKLRLVTRKPDVMAELRWQQFVDMATSHGATPAEVCSMFKKQDVSDLLKETDDRLPLHARTIAQTAIRKRRVVPIRAGIQVPTVNRQSCGNCQHYRRTEHPRLGKCSAGESTGACGNWDSDLRNYCQEFRAIFE